MAEVTQEMILDYLIKKGGVVKNVDLVRHFRKYLQIDSPREKDRARIIFKERVNTVASIKADKKEKYLHLRPEFSPPGGLNRPPTGRSLASSDTPPLDNGGLGEIPSHDRFSLVSTTSDRSSVFSLYAPTASSPPPKQVPSSPHPSTIQSSNPAPPPPQATPPSKQKGLGEDNFGSSLMAELSSFGSLFDSFGVSSSSGPATKSATSSTPPATGTVSAIPPSSQVTSSQVTSSQVTSAQSSSYLSSNNISRVTPSQDSTPSSHQSATSQRNSAIQNSRNTTPQTTTYSANSAPQRTMAYSANSTPQSSTTSYSAYSSPPRTTANLAPQTTTYSTPLATSYSAYSSPPRTTANLAPQTTTPLATSYSANSTPKKTSAYSANSTPQKSSNKKSGGRGQSDLDFDLTSVLSSLPSANPSSLGKKAKTSSVVNSTGYQNSTKFNQPKTSSSGYQNSTKFNQPKTSPSSFQNSTRFDQPNSVSKESNSRGVLSDGRNSIQENTPLNRPPPTLSNSPEGRRQAPPAPLRTTSISRSSQDSPSLLSSNSISNKLPSHDYIQTNSSLLNGPHPLTSSHTPPNTTPTNPGGGAPDPTFSSLGGIDIGSMFSDWSSHTSVISSSKPHPPSEPHPPSGKQSSPSYETERVGQTTPPHMRKLGPTVSVPVYGVKNQVDRRQHSADATSHRQDSMDSIPDTPTIRVESPTNEGSNGSPSHSRCGRSPPYSSETRGRAITFSYASSTGSLPTIGPVQLRSKDGKTGNRTSGSILRRSKNLEKNASLDNFTRLSISMTPPSSRKPRPPAPDVAPKPLRSASPARSNEDLSYPPASGDDDHSEYDNEYMYEEIDPFEREWMLAGAQADIDGLQRLMMTDSSLLNRKGFLHGYTALHWAAKHGRMDILSMLLLQGAKTDIKSNGGLTPLHMASQAGHDNILEVLVTRHNANINIRENGGRRAIDLLNHKASDHSKLLLSSQLNTHGLPVRVEKSRLPSTFSGPRDPRSSLERNWRSQGDLLISAALEDKGSINKKILPRQTIKKTFSFRNRNKIKDQKVAASPKREKRSVLIKKDARHSSDSAYMYDSPYV